MTAPKNARAILGVLGALSMFGPLSIDTYLPALPTIEAQLHTTAAATQRTLSTYFLGLALAQLFYGPLADRFGRRKPLFFGLAAYAAASLGAAFAPTITWLAAMRFFQAVGAAAGVVVTRAVVRDLYSGRDAANALSVLILIMGAAPILAPLLGGAILAVAGWRAIFALLTATGLLALAGVAAILPETGKPGPTPGVARTYLALLADRDFLAYTLAGGFASAAMFAYIAGSPFVIIELHHVPAGAFGWFFGANAFGYIAMSQLNRRLLKTRSPRELLSVGSVAATGAGFLVLGLAHGGAGGLFAIAFALFAFMASLGLVMPNATAMAMEEQPTRAGAASALLGTLQFSIAATASWMVGALGEKSAVPMGTVMAGCATLSLLSVRVAIRNRVRVAA